MSPVRLRASERALLRTVGRPALAAFPESFAWINAVFVDRDEVFFRQAFRTDLHPLSRISHQFFAFKTALIQNRFHEVHTVVI